MTDSVTLEARKSELEDKLSKLKADMSKSYSADFGEQATERENDEVLEELARKAEEEISAINHVLDRIKQGIEAVCEECGAEISEGRLLAMPTTTCCVECQSQLDS